MARKAHTLRFILDGRAVCIDEPPPTLTVLDYLRGRADLRGTKEGCAEGDCGACTVVLGELAPDGGSVGYHAINSCIRFLATIDGKELLTVEALGQPGGTAHPVQQAMIDHHASQCGFCTPGFVMSLSALYLSQPTADRDQVVDALSGNLCRCTGYRPLIEAGLRQWDYPEPTRWSRQEAQSPAHLDALRELQRAGGESLSYDGFDAPRSLHELVGVLAGHPDSVLLAGGTDLGLWVTKQLRDLPTLVYLGDVAELKRIEHRPAELWIGAAVTHAEAWPELLRHFPELEEQARRFASPPIRNSATLCGNLANGSPIGDAIPALLALGAQLDLSSASGTRELALEDFYLGYQRKDLRPGEFIAGVRIPARAAGALIASYKVAKRCDQDISAVCATLYVECAGERVRCARLSYGGMAAIACRARHAEAALMAAGWNAAGIEAAVAGLALDFTPLSDLRASGAYRLRAAGNLLRRFFRQQTASTATRTADAVARAAPGGRP